MSAAIKRIINNLPTLKTEIDYSEYVKRAMPNTVTRSIWAKTGQTLGAAIIKVQREYQHVQGQQRRPRKGKRA